MAFVLAQPVRLRTLIWGKVATRGLFMLALIATVVMAALSFGVEGPVNRDVVVRLILWMAVVVAHWCFLVRGVRRRQRPRFRVGDECHGAGGLWLTLIMVVPAAMNLAVAAACPMPSRVEWIETTRRVAGEAKKREEQIAARYFHHPELAPASALEGLRKAVVTIYTRHDEVAKELDL
ncbi:hypothetical protein Sinac_1989 [Singulisphaera acidiphila DSM 18658]|uniref:Uncharacterized protein n=2 Tax=Singulisphaera acidiphila TaxID=466153 RepID=L0DAR3_SINAD|nr:hypothetical protein Sinac_1989 [Singulisphaera acidiphila DSM 18658]